MRRGAAFRLRSGVRAAALGAAVIGLTGLGAASGTAVAQSLVADLSRTQIDISTGFAGEELLLFGATEGKGDIVMTVTGPRRDQVVRRKERVAGIWVNGESLTFRDVPAYYRVAASRPLADITGPKTLDRLDIGTDRLELIPVEDRPAGEVREFREALVRNKQRLALYSQDSKDISDIRISQGRLFRTNIPFPANVPTGEYLVNVYLFKSGRLVSQTHAPVLVRKAGLEAEIFRFARERAAWYGAIAIAVALLAGWLAGVIFKRT